MQSYTAPFTQRQLILAEVVEAQDQEPASHSQAVLAAAYMATILQPLFRRTQTLRSLGIISGTRPRPHVVVIMCVVC